MKRNHCLFCCSVAGIEYRHWCWFLQPTTAICVYNSERRHHKTPLSYCWTHQTLPRGWMPLSWISPITTQRRPAYENDSFRYVTKGAESEQTAGAPFYQWMDCKDHAGVICVPHSGSWQAQGGPLYVCRHQRKHVFHNMGSLKNQARLYC